MPILDRDARLLFATRALRMVGYGLERDGSDAGLGVFLLLFFWVGVLFVMANTVWQASGPPPAPEQAFLGIPASVYYAAALYVGAVLMLLVATMPERGTEARSAGTQDAPDRPIQEPV